MESIEKRPVTPAVMVLTSGQSLKCAGIVLYPEADVIEIADLRSKAAQSLGATGAGLGVIGAPNLQFAATALAVGFLNKMAANAAQKAGLDALGAANSKQLALRRKGRVFGPGAIEDLDVPDPSAWWALGEMEERRVLVNLMSGSERSQFLARHGKTRHDIVGGFVTINERPRYIHAPGEFVKVVTEVGEMLIRWAAVAAFFPSQAVRT